MAAINSTFFCFLFFRFFSFLFLPYFVYLFAQHTDVWTCVRVFFFVLSADKYELPRPELIRSDNAIYDRHFRVMEMYDCVVCDPPYGIRCDEQSLCDAVVFFLCLSHLRTLSCVILVLGGVMLVPMLHDPNHRLITLNRDL